jgi:hypothetical protein
MRTGVGLKVGRCVMSPVKLSREGSGGAGDCWLGGFGIRDGGLGGAARYWG